MITVRCREIGTGFSQSVGPVSIFSFISQAGGRFSFYRGKSHYFLSDLAGNVLPQTPSYSELPRNRNWLLSVGRPSFYFLLCLSGRCGSVSILDKDVTCCIAIFQFLRYPALVYFLPV